MVETPEYDSDRIFNVPNSLCAIRLVGSFVLFWLAVTGSDISFLVAFVAFAATDWIDGKLAILLHQRTEFGARLDSVADAALYSATIFGIFWRKWDVIQLYSPWIVVAVISYGLTSVAGLIKFGRVPSYHTYAAKVSAYFAFMAVICLFSGWANWPVLAASVAVTLTNLEATVMTIILPRWISDLRSVVHAYDCRRQIS